MNNITPLKKVVNYKTDMDSLHRLEYKCGVVEKGYILDFDDESNPKNPRFIFEEYASGAISEEYFSEIKSVMYISRSGEK
mgnify:CR=1 FL=1|tara:strand:+ start:1629 stop:1868 length:240 start_codon:yes stop_codon:yes gene_type:complete